MLASAVRWLQVVGKAEVLTPADRAFLESRHLCQDVLTSRWSNQSMWRSSARVRKQLDTELNQTDPYTGPVTRCTRTELEVGPRQGCGKRKRGYLARVQY